MVQYNYVDIFDTQHVIRLTTTRQSLCSDWTYDTRPALLFWRKWCNYIWVEPGHSIMYEDEPTIRLRWNCSDIKITIINTNKITTQQLFWDLLICWIGWGRWLRLRLTAEEFVTWSVCWSQALFLHWAEAFLSPSWGFFFRISIFISWGCKNIDSFRMLLTNKGCL